MGGKSSSSSTTQNFTDASTVNANQAGNLAGIVGEGNSSVLTILDGGAINRAFSFGGESLDVLNDSITDSLDFSESVLDSGFDIADRSLDQAFGFGLDSLAFNEETIAQSFEFGAGSLDQAFAFGEKLIEQSSLENRSILNSAINASNEAQSNVIDFTRNVATPQTELIKAGLVGLGILIVGGMVMKGRG